jgi:hypothetical protein
MNPSLLQTIQEVVPNEREAMVLHALISARFTVIEKIGKTVDDLPVLVRMELNGVSVAVRVGQVRMHRRQVFHPKRTKIFLSSKD